MLGQQRRERGERVERDVKDGDLQQAEELVQQRRRRQQHEAQRLRTQRLAENSAAGERDVALAVALDQRRENVRVPRHERHGIVAVVAEEIRVDVEQILARLELKQHDALDEGEQDVRLEDGLGKLIHSLLLRLRFAVAVEDHLHRGEVVRDLLHRLREDIQNNTRTKRKSRCKGHERQQEIIAEDYHNTN